MLLYTRVLPFWFCSFVRPPVSHSTPVALCVQVNDKLAEQLDEVRAIEQEQEVDAT